MSRPVTMIGITLVSPSRFQKPAVKEILNEWGLLRRGRSVYQPNTRKVRQQLEAVKHLVVLEPIFAPQQTTTSPYASLLPPSQ
ncbi:hypothetical protein QOT17_000259 [Balamuthia mandrillaris]